jgi:hypothetical protein
MVTLCSRATDSKLRYWNRSDAEEACRHTACRTTFRRFSCDISNADDMSYIKARTSVCKECVLVLAHSLPATAKSQAIALAMGI